MGNYDKNLDVPVKSVGQSEPGVEVKKALKSKSANSAKEVVENIL